MTVHNCFAPDCTQQVPSDRMLCYRHWFRLPTETRRMVSAVFRSYLGGSATLAELRGVQRKALQVLSHVNHPA